MNALFLLVPVMGAFLTSVLCAQAPANAATKKPLDPAVEALLTKMLGKRGVARAGKDTAIAMQGAYEETFEGVGAVAKGKQRDLFVGTELARCRSEVGKSTAMEKGLRGDLVWEVDPDFGPKVLRRSHAAVARRFFALLRGDDPRAIYQQIEKTGTQALDGRECTVLRMTPADGKPDTWFVDADGTLARVDTALSAPESAEAAFGMADLMDTSLTFADWQESGGGRFAKKPVLAMGKATVTTTYDTIVVGEPIDAAKFTPPDAVTKLAKEPPPAEGPGYQVVERTAQPVASIRTMVTIAAKQKSDTQEQKKNSTEERSQTEEERRKAINKAMSAQLAIMLPEIGTQLRASGAKGIGAPFARVHSIEDGVIDLEAGIAVQQPIAEGGRVKNSELPGGRCVTCWHVGPYDGLPGACEALLAHLASNKLTPRGAIWEVFWTDPGMVPDAAKWKTQLLVAID
jgi:effector-binding domain-containing protein